MTGADPFDAFVRAYQDMVFATAVRLVGNQTDAEDIAQHVFLKAFQRFDELASSPTTGGWLKTVTRHACLNHLSRYRRRWRFFSEIDSDTGGAEAGFEAGLVAPPAPPDDAGDVTRLEEALRRLPDHQRVPLVLFHFEEMSYQEIAGTLGVSIGKVKTDIHRGRETLKRVLTGDHDFHRS